MERRTEKHPGGRRMQLVNRKFPIFNFLVIPIRTSAVLCILGILSKVILAFLPVLQIIATANFIDAVIGIFNNNQERDAIYIPLGTLIAIIAYSNINSVLMTFIQTKMDMKLTEVFQADLVQKHAKLHYSHIENNETRDLIQRIRSNPVGCIVKGYNDIILYVNIVIRVASVLVLLFIQISWVALIIIIFTIPLFYASYKSGKSTFSAYSEAQKYKRKADYLRDVLINRKNVEERSLFRYSKYLNTKWYDRNESARILEKKASAKNMIRLKTASFMILFISLVITGILIIPLGKGTLSVGMYVGLVSSIFTMIQTLSNDLASVTTDLVNDFEYLRDLYVFNDLTETEGATDTPSSQEQATEYRIEFDDVSFQYPGTDKKILSNFSLTLEPHLHYAFVGVNGAGKTTITKLLTKLYSNYTGEIFINRKNLKDYTLAEIKSLFSVVYQDFAKYQISLQDSLMLGNVNHMNDIKQAFDAINAIHLNNTVDKLPYGLSTPIGKVFEAGVDISGGEWQRVAIARAVVSKAPLIILDEPTAALDPIAESATYQLFGEISKGKSTIFITHRLGAAKLADKIFVIDEGKVAEEGSHDELMAQGGMYAEMFKTQRSWYYD